MRDKSQSNFYHYLVICTGIAICLGPTAIAFNCAGIFIAPVSEALGVSAGTFVQYRTFVSLTMLLALPFAGHVIATNDLRVVLSTSVLLVSGAIFAMGFFTAVWQFYIAGVIIGLGEAFLLFLAVPTLINRWFRKKAGLFLGLCVAFTGIGGVIFNPLGDYLIGAYGWQLGYKAFGTISLAIALPFTLFAIRDYPADRAVLVYGSTDTGMQDTAINLSGVTESRAYKSAAFYALAGFAGLVAFNTIIFLFLPAYMSSLSLTTVFTGLAGAIASVAMAGQALGKIGLGVISDKSVFAGMLLSLVCGASGLLLIWLAPTSVLLVLIGGFLYGPFYASAVVIVPLMTRKIFGVREYEKIYSRISMSSAIMAAVGTAIWGFLIDWAGYKALFILGLLALAGCALLGVYALMAGKILEQQKEYLRGHLSH